MLDASYPASSLSTILVPKFAQLDEFCTRLASFLPNICVITLTIFLFGRHHDPRCPERLARSLPRSRCRKRPGQANSNCQRVKSRIRRRKKEEGSSIPTEDRQEKGVKRVSFVSSGWTDGCPHSASRVLRHPARNPRKNA